MRPTFADLIRRYLRAIRSPVAVAREVRGGGVELAHNGGVVALSPPDRHAPTWGVTIITATTCRATHAPTRYDALRHALAHLTPPEVPRRA